MDNLGGQDFNVLLKGYLDESLNPEDWNLLSNWQQNPKICCCCSSPSKKIYQPARLLISRVLNSQSMHGENWRGETGNAPRVMRSGRFYRITVAASICLIFILGAAYF